jgi:hypothetical protein
MLGLGVICPGSVLSGICCVQGLLCLGFVVSKVCRVQGLSCPGFAVSRICPVQGLSVQSLSVQGLSVLGLSVYRHLETEKGVEASKSQEIYSGDKLLWLNACS